MDRQKLARGSTEETHEDDGYIGGFLMQITLRSAIQNDVPEMHTLRTSVKENVLSDSNALGHSDYLPYLGDIGETWVAIANGRLAGFVTLDWHKSSVWALFVSPQFEGNGVGKALMNHMLQSARARQIHALSLTTTSGTRAERFYCSQGWQEMGPAPNGEITLQLILSPDDK